MHPDEDMHGAAVMKLINMAMHQKEELKTKHNRIIFGSTWK